MTRLRGIEFIHLFYKSPDDKNYKGYIYFFLKHIQFSNKADTDLYAEL